MVAARGAGLGSSSAEQERVALARQRKKLAGVLAAEVRVLKKELEESASEAFRSRVRQLREDFARQRTAQAGELTRERAEKQDLRTELESTKTLVEQLLQKLLGDERAGARRKGESFWPRGSSDDLLVREKYHDGDVEAVEAPREDSARPQPVSPGGDVEKGLNRTAARQPRADFSRDHHVAAPTDVLNECAGGSVSGSGVGDGMPDPYFQHFVASTQNAQALKKINDDACSNRAHGPASSQTQTQFFHIASPRHRDRSVASDATSQARSCSYSCSKQEDEDLDEDHRAASKLRSPSNKHTSFIMRRDHHPMAKDGAHLDEHDAAQNWQKKCSEIEARFEEAEMEWRREKQRLLEKLGLASGCSTAVSAGGGIDNDLDEVDDETALLAATTRGPASGTLFASNASAASAANSTSEENESRRPPEDLEHADAVQVPVDVGVQTSEDGGYGGSKAEVEQLLQNERARLDISARGELKACVDAQQRDLAELRAAHATELDGLRAQHASELADRDSVSAKMQQELDSLSEKMFADLGDLKRKLQEDMSGLFGEEDLAPRLSRSRRAEKGEIRRIRREIAQKQKELSGLNTVPPAFLATAAVDEEIRSLREALEGLVVAQADVDSRRAAQERTSGPGTPGGPFGDSCVLGVDPGGGNTAGEVRLVPYIEDRDTLADEDAEVKTAGVIAGPGFGTTSPKLEALRKELAASSEKAEKVERRVAKQGKVTDETGKLRRKYAKQKARLERRIREEGYNVSKTATAQQQRLRAKLADLESARSDKQAAAEREAADAEARKVKLEEELVEAMDRLEVLQESLEGLKEMKNGSSSSSNGTQSPESVKSPVSVQLSGGVRDDCSTTAEMMATSHEGEELGEPGNDQHKEEAEARPRSSSRGAQADELEHFSSPARSPSSSARRSSSARGRSTDREVAQQRPSTYHREQTSMRKSWRINVLAPGQNGDAIGRQIASKRISAVALSRQRKTAQLFHEAETRLTEHLAQFKARFSAVVPAGAGGGNKGSVFLGVNHLRGEEAARKTTNCGGGLLQSTPLPAASYGQPTHVPATSETAAACETATAEAGGEREPAVVDGAALEDQTAADGAGQKSSRATVNDPKDLQEHAQEQTDAEELAPRHAALPRASSGPLQVQLENKRVSAAEDMISSGAIDRDEDERRLLPPTVSDEVFGTPGGTATFDASSTGDVSFQTVKSMISAPIRSLLTPEELLEAAPGASGFSSVSERRRSEKRQEHQPRNTALAAATSEESRNSLAEPPQQGTPHFSTTSTQELLLLPRSDSGSLSAGRRKLSQDGPSHSNSLPFITLCDDIARKTEQIVAGDDGVAPGELLRHDPGRGSVTRIASVGVVKDDNHHGAAAAAPLTPLQDVRAASTSQIAMSEAGDVVLTERRSTIASTTAGLTTMPLESGSRETRVLSACRAGDDSWGGDESRLRLTRQEADDGAEAVSGLGGEGPLPQRGGRETVRFKSPELISPPRAWVEDGGSEQLEQESGGKSSGSSTENSPALDLASNAAVTSSVDASSPFAGAIAAGENENAFLRQVEALAAPPSRDEMICHDKTAPTECSQQPSAVRSTQLLRGSSSVAALPMPKPAPGDERHDEDGFASARRRLTAAASAPRFDPTAAELHGEPTAAPTVRLVPPPVHSQNPHGNCNSSPKILVGPLLLAGGSQVLAEDVLDKAIREFDTDEMQRALQTLFDLHTQNQILHWRRAGALRAEEEGSTSTSSYCNDVRAFIGDVFATFFDFNFDRVPAVSFRQNFIEIQRQYCHHLEDDQTLDFLGAAELARKMLVRMKFFRKEFENQRKISRTGGL